MLAASAAVAGAAAAAAARGEVKGWAESVGAPPPLCAEVRVAVVTAALGSERIQVHYIRCSPFSCCSSDPRLLPLQLLFVRPQTCVPAGMDEVRKGEEDGELAIQTEE